MSRARVALIAELGPAGHWTGELSSSALATATAVFALAQADPVANRDFICSGLQWLSRHQNGDGGYGDTPESPSNIATSMLAWAALALASREGLQFEADVQAVEAYLAKQAGSLEPRALVAALERRYGLDRTFAAPILAMCAMAGRLGAKEDCWALVPPLPLELATLPHRLLKHLRLPVVSYALPALVAIGLVRFVHAPPASPVTRAIRGAAVKSALAKLRAVQPSSGGFLEAAPLTSFVLMSLCFSGYRDHAVVQAGANFLRAGIRPDGSWPIDTNLSTWLTTLAVGAVADDVDALPVEQRRRIMDWLLDQQLQTEHPYTHCSPGGWGWTDLSGSVCDADDTAGALLALRRLGLNDARIAQAAQAGLRWLLDVTNRDGGVPTFCRGWGKLPFDRSSPDLTAHAMMAYCAYLKDTPPRLARDMMRAIDRGVRYLQRQQRADGAFVPLWFGSQECDDQANPLYGSARVLMALVRIAAALPATGGRSVSTAQAAADMACTSAGFISGCQAEGGGFGACPGATPTIEETALAVDALAQLAIEAHRGGIQAPDRPRLLNAVQAGCRYLLERTQGGRAFEPAPIGLYFAKLWYHEKLYPLIFTVGALSRASALARLAPREACPQRP